VGENEVNSSKSFKQSDLVFDEQISSFSLEPLVWLLLDDNNYITWFSAWEFISLSMESELSIVWSTLVDGGINYLLLFDYLLSIASLTFVCFINDFTLATTIIASSLRL